jgi:hypothetical protein
MSDWKLSFRYRKGSNIDIWVHSDIWYLKIFYHIHRIRTQDNCFQWRAPYLSATMLIEILRMSDSGYRIKVYSGIDIMSNSLSSVRYRKFRYQAQSDIADHRYWTKCPPMEQRYLNSEIRTTWRKLMKPFCCQKSDPMKTLTTSAMSFPSAASWTMIDNTFAEGGAELN